MKKILIVDDEQIIVDAYELVLTKAGYHVLTAPNGRIAVELVQNEQPDLMLLDMLMPEMNGIEVLKRLKKAKLLSNMKVIAFSNIENPEVVAAAKKFDIEDYLLKVDYTPHQVVDLVKRTLG